MASRADPSRTNRIQCSVCGHKSIPCWDSPVGVTWWHCSNDECSHYECSVNNDDALKYHVGSVEWKYSTAESERGIIDQYLSLLGRNLSEASTVIDVGCGGGALVDAINGKELVEGIDVNAKSLSIRHDKNICRASVFDLESWPKKYDLVICFHVIEHIKDIDRAAQCLCGASNGCVAIELPHSKKKAPFSGHVHEFSYDSSRIFASHPPSGWVLDRMSRGTRLHSTFFVWRKA